MTKYEYKYKTTKESDPPALKRKGRSGSGKINVSAYPRLRLLGASRPYPIITQCR
jgi:hypothetical protein